MFSDALLEEMCRAAPLRPILLREAWPSLTMENKLEIIHATARSGSGIPGDLVDLALADKAVIVRAWAAFNHWFKVPRVDPDDDSEIHDSYNESIDQAERNRVAAIEEDASSFVRAAAHVQGNIELYKLADDPQLIRLLRIRRLRRSDTKFLARFIEEGLAKNVPLEEIRECLFEYFASDAFKSGFSSPEPRGIYESSPSAGWNSLWALAASVPEEIGAVLVNHLPLEFKRWQVSQKLLHALPAALKSSIVFGDSAPAEELRQTLLKTPKDYDAGVVDSAARYYSFVVEEGGGPIPKEERAEAELESTPYRKEAVFRSIKRLRQDGVEQQQSIATLLESISVLRNAVRGLKTQLTYLYVGIFISMGVLFFAPPELRGYIWIFSIFLLAVGAAMIQEYARQIARVLRWVPEVVLVGIAFWAVNHFYPGHGDAIGSGLFLVGLLAVAAFILFRLTRAVVRCIQGYRASGWEGFWKAANEKIW